MRETKKQTKLERQNIYQREKEEKLESDYLGVEKCESRESDKCRDREIIIERKRKRIIPKEETVRKERA